MDMRGEKVPWPKTIEELSEYIVSVTNREHDYGTSAYAISLAATAAFQYVAHKVGATGFQASCADLDILRRTRGMDGPFILLKGEDMLYPQYDLAGKLQEAMSKWADWAADEAAKKIAGHSQDQVHPNVWAHWVKLAAHKSNPSLQGTPLVRRTLQGVVRKGDHDAR